MVKRLQEVLRNEFIKTFLKSQELGFNSSHEPPVYVQPGKQKNKSQNDYRITTGTVRIFANGHKACPQKKSQIGAPDIFFLVLLRNGNISSVRLEFVLQNSAKSIVFHTEGMVQNWSDVILSVNKNAMSTSHFCK